MLIWLCEQKSFRVQSKIFLVGIYTNYGQSWDWCTKHEKGEGRLNTFTPVVTYLLYCNTNVTSLLSDTAIKSVIAYVTDYITKSPLKTHTVFEAVKLVFSKMADNSNVSLDWLQKARQVITTIVNALTSQSEIGALMAAMYTIKNPDHYKSHQMRQFY